MKHQLFLLHSGKHLLDLEIDEASVVSVALREALAGPEAAAWKKAIALEYYDLQRLGCWTVVEVPLDFEGNVCTTKWILTKKYDSKTGKLLKYKARLVVRGFSQVYGVDYFETYSPVVAATTIRIFLTLVAAFDLELRKLDVKNAFIHAKFEEDVYVWPPEGYGPQQPFLMDATKEDLDDEKARKARERASLKERYRAKMLLYKLERSW
mmetsp:Transcript_17771/g.54312  ORF Transcript_17771/g.54312 Transcript_17771/m.54312 type:complete len:209 (+) Transcript_17771:34-660(+)